MNFRDSIRFRWVESLRFPYTAYCDYLPAPPAGLW